MLQEELQERKRQKWRDSEEESEFLNVSEQLKNKEKGNDESCFGRAKHSFFPIFLTLIFIAFSGVIVYRYLWILNNHKVTNDENVPKILSLQKHLPQQDNETPVLPITPAKELIDVKKPLQSEAQTPKIKQPQRNQFPQKLWIFDRSNKDSKHLQDSTSYNDYMRNWQNYSNLSNLNVQKVNKENYKTFIKDPKVTETVEKLVSLPGKPEEIEKISQQIIMFNVLKNNGGIMIGGDMIFTKPLDEFLKIYANNPNSTTFIFDSFSSDGLTTFDHENYFIMAQRSCPVMALYAKVIMEVFSMEIGKIESSSADSPQQIWTEVLLQKMTTMFGLLLKANSLFKNNIYLLGKQTHLNIQNTPFLNFTLQNHFKYLYSLQQKSLQEIIGPVGPIVQFSSMLYKNYLLKSSEDEKNQIFKQSFIYQHLLSNSTALVKPLQSKEKLTQQTLWSFPKVIWTFFTKNHISNPLHKHFLQNLLQTSKKSKFQLIILTESNLKTVLNESQLRQIQVTLQKMDMNRNPNAMSSIEEDKILSSIIKLKILNKYGGIFIEHGQFFIEDLSWIQKVNSNNHLFNKKPDQFPEAFMFHKNGDFRWIININSGEKQSDNITYLTKFIVGNKDSLLIKNWLMETEKNLILKESELQQKLFSQCQFKDYDFKNIFQVTLQCMMIKSRRSDPTKTQGKYNVWSINSLLAGDKLEMISKQNKEFCYSFDSSYNEFVQKYGHMGYISPLQAQGFERSIDFSINNSRKYSIFGKFFIGDSQTKQETHQLLSGQNSDHIKSVLTKLQQQSNIS